jgi:hypothetical protein
MSEDGDSTDMTGITTSFANHTCQPVSVWKKTERKKGLVIDEWGLSGSVRTGKHLEYSCPVIFQSRALYGFSLE